MAIHEDDPRWQWWSMGNQTAGADYAAAHPAPTGYVTAPASGGNLVAQYWPELVALFEYLQSLSATPFQITVQEIVTTDRIVSLGPDDTSPLHMFEDNSGITEAAYEARWGFPWPG